MRGASVGVTEHRWHGPAPTSSRTGSPGACRGRSASADRATGMAAGEARQHRRQEPEQPSFFVAEEPGEPRRIAALEAAGSGKILREAGRAPAGPGVEVMPRAVVELEIDRHSLLRRHEL